MRQEFISAVTSLFNLKIFRDEILANPRKTVEFLLSKLDNMMTGDIISMRNMEQENIELKRQIKEKDILLNELGDYFLRTQHIGTENMRLKQENARLRDKNLNIYINMQG